MQAQLKRILDEFETVRGRLHRLVDDLTEAQWAARAADGRWSVAECVAHLNLTSEAYLPLLRQSLEDARRRDGPTPARYRRDPVGWILSLAMGPVPRVGGFRLGAVRTTSAFVPERGQPKERVVDAFDRLQREQAEIVRAADRHPIDRAWVISPFDPRLRYNLYSALVILPRHQRRHIVQAERALP